MLPISKYPYLGIELSRNWAGRSFWNYLSYGSEVRCTCTSRSPPALFYVNIFNFLEGASENWRPRSTHACQHGPSPFNYLDSTMSFKVVLWSAWAATEIDTHPSIQTDPSTKTEHVVMQVCGDCGSLHKLLPVCQPTRVWGTFFCRPTQRPCIHGMCTCCVRKLMRRVA